MSTGDTASLVTQNHGLCCSLQEMANKKATVGVMITALKEAGMSSIAEEVFKTSV